MAGSSHDVIRKVFVMDNAVTPASCTNFKKHLVYDNRPTMAQSISWQTSFCLKYDYLLFSFALW